MQLVFVYTFPHKTSFLMYSLKPFYQTVIPLIQLEKLILLSNVVISIMTFILIYREQNITNYISLIVFQ